EPAHFRRAGAGRKGRVQAVYVEGQIGRTVTDHLQRLLDNGGDAHSRDFLGMDHRHAGLVGEFPKIFGRAADADLNRAGRVEHAVEHGVAERTAVMELCLVEGAAGVAMRVDVDHAYRALPADRLEDGVGNRVVATDTDGRRARLDDLADTRLDVGMALSQRVAAREGDVADIGDLELEDWRAVEHMVVEADALDRAQRPRAE